MTLVLRLFILAWRLMCLGYTRLRWPSLWCKPELLLRYETPAQKAAYGRDRSPEVGSFPTRPTKVLVVIPFRDKWHLTDTCLKTLKEQDLSGLDVHVVLVDNGSEEAATADGISRLLDESPRPNLSFSVDRLDIPFNYSRLNNLAVTHSAEFSADYILLLNNDVYFTATDTIVRMARFLNSKHSAASVGCSLLYPDQTIQHLFIFVGSKIVGAHPYKGRRLDLSDPWCKEPRPVGGATAALLMVRASDYNAVGGFDEELPSCYQDVDLALKFIDRGKTNWVIPQLTAIHAETQTRRPDHNWREVKYMSEKWGAKLWANDFVPPEFSRWSEQIALTVGEGDYPWRWLAKLEGSRD